MAAAKKSFLRSNQSDVDRTETLMEFSIAFFSGRDKSKSVENVYNVSVTSVAEFTFLTVACEQALRSRAACFARLNRRACSQAILTDAFDCRCCAEPL